MSGITFAGKVDVRSTEASALGDSVYRLVVPQLGVEADIRVLDRTLLDQIGLGVGCQEH